MEKRNINQVFTFLKSCFCTRSIQELDFVCHLNRFQNVTISSLREDIRHSKVCDRTKKIHHCIKANQLSRFRLFP